ncbi:MAG: TIGR03557 family F420-dependent LLM class oxidoreductase [Ardenticatenaceae bacterium]|nr:TIGR03557 family F420-dependent LLM class oxidoreductase [Ardenticatenaceae bacterium]
MAQIGYKLSSEEHGPKELVRYAQRAEETGFSFAMISDHYHPWIDKQGQSPYAWTVIGGVAQATRRLRLGTGVTCPTVRYHPAIIAQAAATAATMMPGRFMLGVGTGENLNEHILGDRWPPTPIRIDMLEEAVAVIRLLWQGGMQDHHGRFYTVENAQIYTLPEQLPPILVAASGDESATAAGQIGDGLISTAPDAKLVQTFQQAGGSGKPCYAECSVCWAESEEQAKQTAYEWWPTAALKGELGQELPVPTYFEQAVQMVTPDDVARVVVVGPDPQKHIDGIKKYLDAGFEHVWIHQIGPNQEGFVRFYQEDVLPGLRRQGLIE